MTKTSDIINLDAYRADREFDAAEAELSRWAEVRLAEIGIDLENIEDGISFVWALEEIMDAGIPAEEAVHLARMRSHNPIALVSAHGWTLTAHWDGERTSLQVANAFNQSASLDAAADEAAVYCPRIQGKVKLKASSRMLMDEWMAQYDLFIGRAETAWGVHS